jgi:heme/copper-type cytochrome/quinol oxidase subunit 4
MSMLHSYGLLFVLLVRLSLCPCLAMIVNCSRSSKDLRSLRVVQMIISCVQIILRWYYFWQ